MPNNLTIQTQVLEILKIIKPKMDELELKNQSDLFSSGVLDSLDIFEFITALEEGFNLKFDNADLIPQNFWSIESVAKIVSSKTKTVEPGPST